MSERGTSLLEATIALAIGSLLAAAATSELRGAAAALSQARQVHEAMSAARAALEHGLAEPCAALAEIGRDCPSELRCTVEASELSAVAAPTGVTRIVRLTVTVSTRTDIASSLARLVTVVRRPEPCSGAA